MAKRNVEPPKTSSGTFRVRKSDGVELEKKTVWLEAGLARRLDLYCAGNRINMSTVVSRLLLDFLPK